MTEDERIYRAHLALHGQPLLIEWMTRAVTVARGARFRDANDAWRDAVLREYGEAGEWVLTLPLRFRVGGHTYVHVPMFGEQP